MENDSNNQIGIDVDVHNLKREVDALQIKLLSETKPWYKKVSVLIALFALIFSFGTTVISYQRTIEQDQRSLKQELRGLILQLVHLPLKGIELNEKQFPINKQVKAACEMLGLDPLYVANEGIFLAVVKNDIAESVLSILRKFEFGKDAAIIGCVQNDNPGKVFIKSAIGGKRVVGMMAGEQLPRIC